MQALKPNVVIIHLFLIGLRLFTTNLSRAQVCAYTGIHLRFKVSFKVLFSHLTQRHFCQIDNTFFHSSLITYFKSIGF